MINGPFCQEDLTTLSVYALNIRALKYIKRKLTELKEISWRFPLFVIDRTIRKINEDMEDLNSINQLSLMDIYGILPNSTIMHVHFKYMWTAQRRAWASELARGWLFLAASISWGQSRPGEGQAF